MSIDSLNSANLNVNQPKVPVKDSVDVQFRANDNNKLQRTPQQDEFVKKNNVGVKVGIGAILATIVAGTADAVFNDGKNLKKIFKNFGKKPKGPVKDIDLGVKTPEERKVLDEAIDRLKGKTSETANSAGTKTAGEAVGGSHKRTYSGSSSSSGSAQSSRSKRGNKRVNAEPKVVSEVKTEVKPSGREVIKGEVNNYRNTVEDARLANNADQAHLGAQERKIVEQGLEDVSTEVKLHNEVLSEADRQVLQNHQEKVAKEYADAHTIENIGQVVEPKVATVPKEAIDKLSDEIKGLDGSIKKLEQQIAGAKKFGKNTENLEKQLSNLQQKRATKVAELEGMKKPVAEPKVEGKKGKKKVEKAKTKSASVVKPMTKEKFMSELDRLRNESLATVEKIEVSYKSFQNEYKSLTEAYELRFRSCKTEEEVSLLYDEFMSVAEKLVEKLKSANQEYSGEIQNSVNKIKNLAKSAQKGQTDKEFLDKLAEFEKMDISDFMPGANEYISEINEILNGFSRESIPKKEFIVEFRNGWKGWDKA